MSDRGGQNNRRVGYDGDTSKALRDIGFQSGISDEALRWFLNHFSGPTNVGLRRGFPDWYSYPFVFGNLAANASGVQSVTIQNDSAYYLWRLKAAFNLHGQTAPFSEDISAPLYVNIQDTSSSLYLFYQPVPLTTVRGDGLRGGQLPYPRRFAGRSTVTVTVANQDPTNQYDNIAVVFEGWRLLADNPEDATE